MSNNTAPEIANVRRRLNNLRSFVRATVTGWEKDRNARGQYAAAFEAFVRAEDAHGVDAIPVALDNRLRALRDEALAAGLLTYADVSAAEDAAVARADARGAAA